MPDDSDTPDNPAEEPDFPDILGQDDIDSLLSQVVDTKEESAFEAEDAGSRGRENNIYTDQVLPDDVPLRIESYDFRNPVFLGEMEMRRLRLIHEDFIRYLEARMTLFFRCDFSLKMTQLSTKSYEQAVIEVENPTHISLFRASPMPGIGFIEMSPNLALTITSTILGGKGHALRLERYLTKIEIDLIEEFLTVLLDEWSSCWEVDSGNLEPQVVGHEIVANVLQICEKDTVMFSLTMDASLRGATGRIGICVPLFMIEETVRKLNVKPESAGGASAIKKGPAWRALYAQIPIDADAEFFVGSYSIEDVFKWKPGTVLPLGDSAMQEVTLNLARLPLFACEGGVDDDHRAVKINGKIKKEESIWQMKN